MEDSTEAARRARYPSPAYAWFVVGILVAAAMFSYVDRQVVAIVVGPMKKDLGVGDADLGLLYGIFAIFYAVAGLPIAWAADRWSRKRIIAIGIVFWSAATMVTGLMNTFAHVLIARIGVGVGEAALTPSTNSLVGDYFPRDRIPLALSVFQMGSLIGSAGAFIVGGLVLSLVQHGPAPVLPVVGALRPWQQIFVYVGAPGLILAAATLLIKEPARRLAPAAGPPRPPLADVMGFYRCNLATIVLHHLGFLSLGLMGYGFTFWTVSYFTRVHGLEASTAAQTFGWIFLVAGPFGSVWAALMAGRFARAGRKDANILGAMLGGAIVIPIILLIQVAPSATVAFILYAPAMFFVGSPFGLAYGSLPVITPPTMRAFVAAVFMFVISLGMLLGPPITGLFNERIFPAQDGVRFSLMTVTSFFGLLGLALLWLCRRPYAASLARADLLEPSMPEQPASAGMDKHAHISHSNPVRLGEDRAARQVR